jgi:hypothetical protein
MASRSENIEPHQEYNLAGEPWENKEDEQLKKEYNIDKLTILEICKIHKRMPGGIISRLRRLDLIDMRHKARGYEEYQQSDLYKEICKNKKENKEKRIEKKVGSKIQPTINTVFKKTVNELTDIIQIKSDINEIKGDVKKIIELINAVYDFESNQE